ncbi:alpha/beta hydrolase [Leifsonia virtsii]|uniref:Alpha/beta hydrolase fold domain-containing protein n=1 Tax=Leifsonia virtsii TaxID=3035915 RepID=A0ABT8J253_9MICO|nr:alpha/beta hydrolase fold domain-containing protein [Leifsonia virtsii]MDN4599047.1 alpha/beta hydrolase fold domain-containing protein [Leifsonia virtsii]
MSTSTASRPPVDPEIAPLLAALPAGPQLDAQTLPLIRPYSSSPVEPLLEGRAILRREFEVPTADGGSIALTALSPASATSPTACVYWMHGGGRVMGDRFSQLEVVLDWVDRLGLTVVTVEYRLATEVPGATSVEDAYAGLRWVADNAAELGIDAARLIVGGISGGGGIAAGVTLLARDRALPVSAQLLLCPMLDPRNASTSAAQFVEAGTWTGRANDFAWSAALHGADPEAVPGVLAPALAEDFSGLPPTFVDAGSAELFRSEGVAFAERLWSAGVDAELHVWSGGVHGFDALFPKTLLATDARTARSAWLTRILSRPAAGAESSR